MISRTLLLTAFSALLLTNLYFSPLSGAATDSPYPPSRRPDRIALTWSQDPATSQSVTWRTSADVSKAQAEIAVAEDGPGFPKKARSVDATTQPLQTDLGSAHYHSVVFDQLEPSETYVYRVGDGNVWSEWNQFTTVSNKPAPLTFIYLGDAQNDIFSMWSRVIREAYSTAPRANFIVHAGDLVNRGNADAEWGEWFEASGWIHSKIPIVATPGNHEYPGQQGVGRALSRNWRPQFALPENGPAVVAESCYYLDIQGIRLISLNSNEMLEEQAEWLDEVLEQNPNRWAIVTHHHPVHSIAGDRDNPEMRELWQPIYDKHGVDLVLQGHDHTYGRSELVQGKNFRADRGTIYAVSVSGPKMYKIETANWMRRAAENTQLFQVVRVDGDTLRYEAFTARGKLYDSFELIKGKKGRNRLIDLAPNQPERRSSKD